MATSRHTREACRAASLYQIVASLYGIPMRGVLLYMDRKTRRFVGGRNTTRKRHLVRPRRHTDSHTTKAYHPGIAMCLRWAATSILSRRRPRGPAYSLPTHRRMTPTRGTTIIENSNISIINRSLITTTSLAVSSINRSHRVLVNEKRCKISHGARYPHRITAKARRTVILMDMLAGIRTDSPMANPTGRLMGRLTASPMDNPMASPTDVLTDIPAMVQMGRQGRMIHLMGIATHGSS